MEVFRKIKYFINVSVLRRTWTWIRRTIFSLRQIQKMDDASDLRTVSERSWLRQLLNTFWDRDRKWALILYRRDMSAMSYGMSSVHFGENWPCYHWVSIYIMHSVQHDLIACYNGILWDTKIRCMTFSNECEMIPWQCTLHFDLLITCLHCWKRKKKGRWTSLPTFHDVIFMMIPFIRGIHCSLGILIYTSQR